MDQERPTHKRSPKALAEHAKKKRLRAKASLAIERVIDDLPKKRRRSGMNLLSYNQEPNSISRPTKRTTHQRSKGSQV